VPLSLPRVRISVTLAVSVADGRLKFAAGVDPAGRDGTGRCGKKSHFAGREDRMLLGLLPPPHDVIGECRPMRSISLGRVEVGRGGSMTYAMT